MVMFYNSPKCKVTQYFGPQLLLLDNWSCQKG